MQNSEIHVVGIHEIDADIECGMHGELTRTIEGFPGEGNTKHVPPAGECIHYCPDCLENLAGDMGMFSIREDTIIGFLMGLEADYFLDHLEPVEDPDIEALRDERTPEFDGYTEIEVDAQGVQRDLYRE